MNQAVKAIAIAAMPTIPPCSALRLNEPLQVKIGLAPQIQVPGNAAPRLKDESNHVGIALSPVAGIEWNAWPTLNRNGWRVSAEFALTESQAQFVEHLVAVGRYQNASLSKDLFSVSLASNIPVQA